MTEHYIEDNLGCRINYTDNQGRPWSFVVGFGKLTIGAFIYGLFDESEDGYRLLKMFGGPWSQAEMEATINAAPGPSTAPAMSRYLISQMPQVQVAIDRYCDPTPELPLIDPATPITFDNLQAVQTRHFRLVRDPTDATAPRYEVFYP